MSVFKFGQRHKPKKSLLKRILLIGLALFVIVVIYVFSWFIINTRAVDTENQTASTISISTGADEASISKLLEEKGIIRSSVAYQLYARLNGIQGETQAGTYELSPSMSVSDILDKLINGEVKIDLMTILPAQRLDDLREYFLEKGYDEDEVYSALNPDNYINHPALAEKPLTASLEGYLYPESFQYSSLTPLRAIIEASLDQMAELFTPSLKQAIEAQGLTLHEAVIMASIIEREVGNVNDKHIVAQVFLTRYSRGMMLGSDPTAHYGASLVGLEESVLTDTPYNTRIYAGLPPGPISNFSASSLQAVANPAATDYLFFVAGDDGVTHFSRTLSEHEALTRQYCTVLCQ